MSSWAAQISSGWSRADSLAMTGIGLTVLGFIATLIQIKRTKSAAEAAVVAATKTQTRLANNHLLLLIPQLEQIDKEIGASVTAGHHDLVGHHLSAWRWQASVFRALVSIVETGLPADAMEEIQASIAACSETKLKLQPNVPLERATIAVRRATSKVVDQLGALAASLSTTRGVE